MFSEVALGWQPFIESVGTTQDCPSKLRGNSSGTADSDRVGQVLRGRRKS